MGPVRFLFALYRKQLVQQFADSYSSLLCFVALYMLLSPLIHSILALFIYYRTVISFCIP